MRERELLAQMTRPKKNIAVNAVECPDGLPTVGERCRLRLHADNGVFEIRTSAVTNWHQGYPHAIGRIVVETRNSVYSGEYIPTRGGGMR